MKGSFIMQDYYHDYYPMSAMDINNPMHPMAYMGMPNPMYPMPYTGMPNAIYPSSMGMTNNTYPAFDMEMTNQMYPTSNMSMMNNMMNNMYDNMYDAENICFDNQMYPMATLAEQELEKMYPKVYHTVYPAISRSCDTLDSTHGSMHIPTKDEVKRMVDEIYKRVEVDANEALKQDYSSEQERQLGISGRALLRDLITILLIRELIRRRRRPLFGFPQTGIF